MVALLGQSRFQTVNFALVKHHIPYLNDLTKAQLFEAVEKYKDTAPSDEYTPPYLLRVPPYVIDDTTGPLQDKARQMEKELLTEHETHERNVRIAQRVRSRRGMKRKTRSSSNLHYMMREDSLSAQELRILFISILKASYES